MAKGHNVAETRTCALAAKPIYHALEYLPKQTQYDITSNDHHYYDKWHGVYDHTNSSYDL